MTEEQKTMFKRIGDRIRIARKNAGLTQIDLAEKISISPSHMSNIEMGKKNIGIDIFIRISEVLQISADRLLRTNVPEVNAVYCSEADQIMEDCTPDEAETIIKMMRDMKTALHAAKIKTDE